MNFKHFYSRTFLGRSQDLFISQFCILSIFQMLDSGEEGGAGRIGGAVLSGILTFLVLEKVLEISNPEKYERNKTRRLLVEPQLA